MINKIKKVAIRAVKKSGKMLLREYKSFDRGTIKLKSHHEILTRADLLSEEIIINEVKENFPTHGILSEEKGRMEGASDYLWIIDPVDGTTNFSMHNPLWSISLAVAFKSGIILGIVYAPVLNELYIGELGRGAKLVSSVTPFRTGNKIKASNIKGGKVLSTFCHGREEKYVRKAIKYYQYQKLHALDCRQLGSAALELAYVACGRIESIMIPGANSWDVAAGVLLVREAGGWVTDFSGQEWNLDSIDMLASNGRVHKEILRVINR